MAAGALLRHLPWPMDRLRREDIPEYELRAAGGEDSARAPAELVAVFGDSRLKHWRTFTSVEFSPNGKELVSVGDDASIRFWDVENGRELRAFSKGFDPTSIALNWETNVLLTSCAVGQESVIKLWELETGLEKRTLPCTGAHLALSLDGKVLASAGRTESK